MERKRRVFPEAFRREAADRVRASGSPIVRVAEELGLRETVSRRQIGRSGGGTGAPSSRQATSVPSTPSPADLAAGNARPKRESHRAETERDIPKKAALVFGGATPLSEHRCAMPCRAADDVRVRPSRRLETIACRRRMSIAASGR